MTKTLSRYWSGSWYVTQEAKIIGEVSQSPYTCVVTCILDLEGYCSSQIHTVLGACEYTCTLIVVMITARWRTGKCDVTCPEVIEDQMRDNLLRYGIQMNVLMFMSA